MVLARFLVGEPGQRVEVTVSAFPGDVGGLAANVNRWRRQVGLGAVPEAEAVASLLPVKTVDGEGWLVDLNGSMQGRDAVMVGAILPRGGRTWFYKMVGDPAASKANREAFVEFLRASRHPSS
jgi:hypothetical protein